MKLFSRSFFASLEEWQAPQNMMLRQRQDEEHRGATHVASLLFVLLDLSEEGWITCSCCILRHTLFPLPELPRPSCTYTFLSQLSSPLDGAMGNGSYSILLTYGFDRSLGSTRQRDESPCGTEEAHPLNRREIAGNPCGDGRIKRRAPQNRAVNKK
jgi:hypothetical protein